jgi:hypothetical protein
VSNQDFGQTVGPYDLVIIAENGDTWWVERDPKTGGPTGKFQKLDESLTATAKAYDRLNVVLADTTQEPSQGGATCFVLNWKYLVNRSQAFLGGKDGSKR